MKIVITPSGRKVIQLEPGDYRYYTKIDGKPLSPWIDGKKKK